MANKIRIWIYNILLQSFWQGFLGDPQFDPLGITKKKLGKDKVTKIIRLSL